MIKKLICLLWGHKTVHLAATGEQFDTYDPLTMAPIKANYYRYVRTSYCTRCGKDVKQC